MPKSGMLKRRLIMFSRNMRWTLSLFLFLFIENKPDTCVPREQYSITMQLTINVLN